MQNEKLQTEGDEISLRDIVDFLKLNQKLILFSGVAGLLISAIYVILAPKEYEARWQMQMAQYSSNSNSNINSNIIINSNINSEEPSVLVQRLKSPTAYPAEVQQHCGMPESGEYGDYLNKKLEVKTIKEAASAVQFKFRAAKPAQAKQCAEAIVSMIMTQQRSLIEERLAGRQVQLVKYQQSLAEEQLQMEKNKKFELGNLSYLAKLDKLSWLRGRIDALQEEALLSQMHPAKLIAPIYAPSKPIASKVGLVLPLGILLGLMLGVLYAFGQRKAA